MFSVIEEMNLKDVYDKSYSFLIKEAAPYSVTKEMIDEFISNSDIPKCRDIKSAFKMLIIILQDFNRYPRVIQFNNREEQILHILKNCDISYVSLLNPNELLLEFKNEFQFEKETMWLKYSKSIISAAQFMSCFDDDADFRDTFDSFDKNDMTREAFALFLSQKIYNMGFALACNWLKELGYFKFAKPDIHMMDVCEAIGLITRRNDIECFEAILKTAKEAGVDAYMVDKVWWLICSGNFYRYDILLPNPRQRKERFLRFLGDMQKQNDF